MTLSTDERRALAIIAALLVTASAARWLERPQPLLEDVPEIDLAEAEEASRAARPDAAAGNARPGRKPRPDAAAVNVRSGRNPRPDAATAGGAGPPAPIDPNTATAAELDRLPGVGPSLAARIVEERDRRPFTSVEDLTRVRGIGAALANTLADRVSLPAGPMRSKTPPVMALTPVGTAADGRSETTLRERPDINYISSADLQKVQGVGPVLAARLIARRDSLRRFTSWAQIDSVAGVGPAMLSRLKESVVLIP
jgi:competence ComEA-like helix-hairpin-helix protein